MSHFVPNSSGSGKQRSDKKQAIHAPPFPQELLTGQWPNMALAFLQRAYTPGTEPVSDAIRWRWYWDASRWTPMIYVALSAVRVGRSDAILLALQDWSVIRPDLGGPLGTIDPEDLIAEIRYGLVDLIGFIESITGYALDVVEITSSRPALADLLPARLDFRIESTQGQARTLGWLRTPSLLSTTIGRFPRNASKTENAITSTKRLSVPLPVEVGRLPLSIQELRALSPGDWLLTPIFLAHNGALITRIPLPGTGLTLQAHATKGSLTVTGLDPMETPINTSAASTGLPLNSNTVEKLEVEVALTIGTLRMPIADLAALAPGTLLPFSLDNERTAVMLKVSDQKVAAGSFVRVGDRIGVRISETFLHPDTQI